MKKFIMFISFVILISIVQAQESVFSFNDLSVPDTGFYNGNDLQGYFITTNSEVNAIFYNNYDPTWNSWYGWAYSIWHNDTSQDFNNQWSVYSGYLLDTTFALAYVGIDWNNNYENIPVGIKFSNKIKPLSLYVANTTYTALTIKNGNYFSQAFEQGEYFKLLIIGIYNNRITDTIVHYLADYRNNLSYIQKDWAYIDLTSLGTIDSLCFNLVSTDIGDYGMNTPGYFAIDQLRFVSNHTSVINKLPILPQKTLKIYPNPANNYITVPNTIKTTEIYNTKGILMGRWTSRNISLHTLPSDLYIVRLWDGKKWTSVKLIIQH